MYRKLIDRVPSDEAEDALRNPHSYISTKDKLRSEWRTLGTATLFVLLYAGATYLDYTNAKRVADRRTQAQNTTMSTDSAAAADSLEKILEIK